MEEEKNQSQAAKEDDNEQLAGAPIVQTVTTNPQPETEHMEVHHHPDLRHEKKNFREYILEFVMIFLAVTMGFFAENIRENISY